MTDYSSLTELDMLDDAELLALFRKLVDQDRYAHIMDDICILLIRRLFAMKC